MTQYLIVQDLKHSMKSQKLESKKQLLIIEQDAINYEINLEKAKLKLLLTEEKYTKFFNEYKHKSHY